MIKVTAVSYLNTKPFLYGLFKSGLSEKTDLQLDIPSVCAQKLREGEVDLGLVPVAVLPELESPRLLSDFCIGTIGAVKTVCIFSQCPMDAMTHIYLDFHSKTSVELAKILLRDYWKVKPEILPATPGFESKIGGTTGALIIGDRAIGLDKKYDYVYDLGDVWLKHTGLPFVFAAWVTNTDLDPDFVGQLNEALALGIREIPQLVCLIPPPHPAFDLKEYYTHYISYHFDDAKRRALDRFLSDLGATIPASAF
ncbi:MAG: ABC transporter substrate-binding protein [Bacteroidetes bacterium]|nr:MAG: ABC transporter substrate-binding protein [Bacteroidota bacterium]